MRTISATGSSADSAEVSASTPALPAAPTNLAVTGTTATHVSLSWDSVVGATSYQLRRSTSVGGPHTLMSGAPGTTITDTTASPATTYCYVVVALSPAGTSGPSNEATGTTPAAVPVPTGVTASPLQATKVLVSWSSVSGPTAYEVWHARASGGPYSKKGTVSGLSFTHTTAVAGATQYYVVRAVTPAGTSGNSIEATVTTPPRPAAPTSVVASPTSPTKVTVTWNLVTGASAYELWRSSTRCGPYVRKVTVTATSVTDNTAVSGTTYYYIVRTVNADGTSLDSTEVTATTP